MTPTLSQKQEEAVAAARDWFRDVSHEVGDADHFYLAGLAGTGKSTILPAIIDGCGLPSDKVHFCAPTGKAAKVMTEKLAQFGISAGARTIHSSIYRPHPLKAEVLEKKVADTQNTIGYLEGPDAPAAWDGVSKHERLREARETLKLLQIDLDKAYDNAEGPKFGLNVDSDVRKAKLIVVDEASMVGKAVAKDLKTFGVPILAMGDPGQLPPVGDDPGLTDGEPDFFLSEIHRQAADNPIIRLAMDARNGKALKIGNYGDGVRVVSRANDNATYDLDRDAQIICGTHQKRFLITRRLRRELGYKTTGPVAGEPLIVCKNSRTNPALVNGAFVQCETSVGDLEPGEPSFRIEVRDETGKVHAIYAYQGLLEAHTLGRGKTSAHKSAAFRASLEKEHLDFGWAITCHKSQGSQWDEVILHDESNVFREDAAKWLYTGLTRAAKRLTVVV